MEDSGGAGLVSFEDFPRGSCGDAAILLGQYFHDCGFGTWIYVSATVPPVLVRRDLPPPEDPLLDPLSPFGDPFRYEETGVE